MKRLLCRIDKILGERKESPNKRMSGDSRYIIYSFFKFRAS